MPLATVSLFNSQGGKASRLTLRPARTTGKSTMVIDYF